MSSQIGTVDRSYLLQERLGEGAMGTVYRATQLVNGQVVALKLVPRQFATGDELSDELEVQYRLALAREFQTLASLHHPNVIRVLNYGFDQQYGPYYIMELLEAPLTPLEASISRPEEGRIRLIAQLLRALAYIHQRGVIHRDIKPSNVLVVTDELKLVDFGISVERLEHAELAGTAEYMAPELLRGGQPSVTSDLYAVALLFHHMLTGSLPTDTPSMGRMLESLLDEDPSLPPADSDSMQDRLLALLEDDSETTDTAPALPPPLELSPDISPPIRAILGKMLAPDPKDRYENANEVLRELAAVVSFELPVETVATRESFLRATVLIGREAELALLKQAIESAQQGVSSAFLIGGESGVGKSRLIAELRTLALVYGAWVADGQSVSEAGYYYQEWQPMLRELCFRTEMTDEEAAVLKGPVPDLGQLLGRAIPDAPVVKPEEIQARIANTVIGLLRRLTKPLVLIMEDLHWARSESLALLKQLSQHSAQMPLLIVGTFRSDESPQLPAALPSIRHLPLARLSAPQIAQLSESILGTVGQRSELVSYLERQTEGNAFFLVEIVRALAENAGELTRIGQGELPETVLTTGIERIVERRIDHLPVTYRPWLEFAATLGRKLDLPVMETAFPSMPLRSFLIECANAAVLESQGNDWRFAHDKLRETILRRIASDNLRQLHKEVAEAIEKVYAGEQRSSMSPLLASHFHQAGLLDKAMQYYIEAGDNAAKLYLYEEARNHFSAAHTIIRDLPESPELNRLHAELLLKQVHAGLINDPSQVQLRRLGEARKLLESIADTRSATPLDRLRMARVDYYCGRVAHYSGQPRESLRYYQRVLPVAKEFADQELLVMPSYTIGGALFLQGYFGRAQEMLGQAIEPMLQYQGPSIETLRCLLYYSTALAGTGRCQESILGLARAQEWADQSDQPSYRAICLLIIGAAYLLMGDWPKMLQTSESILEYGQRTREALYVFGALDLMAWSQSYLGLHKQAIEARSRAAEMRRAIGVGIIGDWFEAGEAEILLNAGRPEDALRQAQKVAASSERDDLPFSQSIAERAWGCALARHGENMAEAELHFAKALEICERTGQRRNASQTHVFWGRVCRERGDEAAAREHFTQAKRLIESGGYDYAMDELHGLLNGV